MLSENPFEEAMQSSHHIAMPTRAVATSSPLGRNSVGAKADSNAEPPSASSLGSALHHPLQPRFEREVLAKLRVDKPFKGQEVLRPITYFPINVEVLVNNDGHFTVPHVPLGPHQNHINMGVKRNDWTRGSCSTVERRYSEVLELREMLVCQFPTLVLPPLPDKDGVNHLETYFSAEDQIAKQRRNLQFFLSEVAAMPEVVFFSEWVPPFFLDPRETFETGTLLRMRATLGEINAAGKAINEFKKRHRTLVEYATDKITNTSTKLVRSLAKMFWGAPHPFEADSSSSAADHANSGWLTLPTELQADAREWENTAELLVYRQRTLKSASKSFEVFLDALADSTADQIKAGLAMHDYEATLREAECFIPLAEHYRLAATMLEGTGEVEKQFISKRYINVCLRLRFESNYINAVLDAIDHVLSLYRSITASVYDRRDQVHLNNLHYTRAVSEGLRQDYTQRCNVNYTRRMRNLLGEQVIRPMLQTAAAVESSVRSAPFVQLIQDNNFTTF